ncbi:MAG: matrixin family metalloprotease [Myxococcales bacterium]|nr:MAG: matrixin family metalloprotease [Myxococcales bacterium]
MDIFRFNSGKIAGVAFLAVLSVLGCNMEATIDNDHQSASVFPNVYVVFLDFGPGTYHYGLVDNSQRNISQVINPYFSDSENFEFLYDPTATIELGDPNLILPVPDLPEKIGNNLRDILAPLHNGSVLVTLSRPQQGPYTTLVFDNSVSASGQMSCDDSGCHYNWDRFDAGIAPVDFDHIHASHVGWVYFNALLEARGYMEFNAPSLKDEDPSFDKFARQVAMYAAHELGHLLGLDHVNKTGCIMFPGDIDPDTGERIDLSMSKWCLAPLYGKRDKIYGGEQHLRLVESLSGDAWYQDSPSLLREYFAQNADPIDTATIPDSCIGSGFGDVPIGRDICNPEHPELVFKCIAPHHGSEGFALPYEPLEDRKWRALRCGGGTLCKSQEDPTGNFSYCGE